MRRWRQWVGIVVTCGLAGCTVGPIYKRPVVSLPESWSEQLESGVVAQPTDVVQWWSTFGDPVLNSLLERAVDANLDLRIATARVREAGALRGVTAADSWPVIDVAGALRTAVAIARTDEREIETENTGPNCCIDKAQLQVGPVGESSWGRVRSQVKEDHYFGWGRLVKSMIMEKASNAQY